MTKPITDLVLSRGCRHVDWHVLPSAPLEFCLACGFAIILEESSLSSPSLEIRPDQSSACTTFKPSRPQPKGPNAYSYKPLNHQRGRQIRILKLKGGRLDDSLRCDLEHADLQQAPSYEALSYTWADSNGNDTLSHRILCGEDESAIAITSNCDAALRQLRKCDTDRQLWVDAICIDQSNVLERNHQAKNMMAIFRSAQRVVVYLGGGSANVDRLAHYISKDSPGLLPQLLDFASLYRSRWFHRVWVLQEIAVAKDILVMYGSRQLRWADILEHSDMYLRILAAHRKPPHLPPVISFGQRQSTLSTQKLKGKLDLLEVLQISCNTFCKDARDKVYAVLGLIDGGSDLPIQADYSDSISPEYVFLRIATWYIERTNSLDILSFVRNTNASRMSSWIPDWRKCSSWGDLAELRIILPEQMKAQSSTTTSQNKRQVPVIHDPILSNYVLKSSLHVLATRISTVMTLHDHDRSFTEGSNQFPDAHWRLRHPGKAVQLCQDRRAFWSDILETYNSLNEHPYISKSKFLSVMNIPPAFGGPCKHCYRWLALYPSSSKCHCKSLDKMGLHYSRDELRNFKSKLIEYGTDRAMFGTDRTLGIGPEELQYLDEIWLLEGNSIPFILRLTSYNQYKLIDASYLHAASRANDCCSTCNAVVGHERIAIFDRHLTTRTSPDALQQWWSKHGTEDGPYYECLSNGERTQKLPEGLFTDNTGRPRKKGWRTGVRWVLSDGTVIKKEKTWDGKFPSPRTRIEIR